MNRFEMRLHMSKQTQGFSDLATLHVITGRHMGKDEVKNMWQK